MGVVSVSIPCAPLSCPLEVMMDLMALLTCVSRSLYVIPSIVLSFHVLGCHQWLGSGFVVTMFVLEAQGSVCRCMSEGRGLVPFEIQSTCHLFATSLISGGRVEGQ
jgi:hypothetical protein